MSFIVSESILNGAKRLNSIKTMLEKRQKGNKITVNFDMMSENILDALRLIGSGIQEIQQGYDGEPECGNSTLTKLKEKALECLKKGFEVMNDREAVEISEDEYLSFINPFVEMYDLVKEYVEKPLDRIAMYDYKGAWRRAWSYGKYELNSKDVESIFEHIIIPGKRSFTFLDVDANRGESAKAVAKFFDKEEAQGYAISKEQHVYYYSEARQALTRFVGGGIKGCRISQDAFDVVFCVPNIDDSDTSAMREDRKIIHFALERARAGGIVIIGLPTSRLYKDVSLDIARQLENVNIMTSSASAEEVGLHWIIGQRKEKHTTVDAASYIKMRNAFMESYSCVQNYDFTYELPLQPMAIQQFRGATLEDAEIIDMVRNSSAEKNFWENQRVQKMSDANIHPILPLGFGQLGQAIASGLMDGVVHEGSGCSHLAKGRVIKVHDIHRDVDAFSHRVTISDTTSNRVEINVFLPNGEFKRLA